MRVNVTINAGQLAIRTRRRIADILPAIRRSEQESGQRMKDRCKYLSIGFLSSAELKQLGHPYARRRPNPPSDPGIINRQTGLFYNSWHYTVQLLASSTRLTIFNDAPYAAYMLGTRLMIPRPILEKMFKTEGPLRFARLQAAFGDVFVR